MPDSNVMNSRRFTDHLVGADQGFVSEVPLQGLVGRCLDRELIERWQRCVPVLVFIGVWLRIGK
jgi:hypothetical protein